MNNNESSKFYIPEIEEFYVGFECEIMSSYGYQKGIYPEILKQDSLTFQDLIDRGEFHAIERASIRVKYLDKEDIESLGWEFTDQGILYKAKDLNLSLVLILQDQSHNKLPGIGIYNRSLNQCLFSGTIKNKSELKRLMKQLKMYE